MKAFLQLRAEAMSLTPDWRRPWGGGGGEGLGFRV